MKFEVVFCDINIDMKVRGEFEGQPFEAAYTSDDGWCDIECLDEKFNDIDEYDDWDERLRVWLWDHVYEAALKKVQGPIDTSK